MLYQLSEIDGFPSIALPGGGRRYEVELPCDVRAYPIPDPVLLEDGVILYVFTDGVRVGRFSIARDELSLEEVLVAYRAALRRDYRPPRAPGGEPAQLRGHHTSALERAIEAALPGATPPTSRSIRLLP